ncbi:MAG: 4-hydroxy-tetrahydrodipicolinate reductase [Planctomycetaceae bacterium]|nr:4-hydroxy-tetrahydrodipicolinate reductase [Planctomycetaceae bacterium]
MPDILEVAVNGAAGRMGQRIVALSHVDPDLSVIAALEAPGSSHLGHDAGELCGIGNIGVAISAELIPHPDVVIDFSLPAGLESIANVCAERQIPLVAATTGLTPSQRETVIAASQMTPMIVAPSMSLAVNVAMKLVRDAARALKDLPDGVDVEIIERHHRYKEDAPSGTALKFGEIVIKEMGQTEQVHGRHGHTGKRPQSEIGYHALRTGDNVGEHQIVFGMLGETLEVSVRGNTRDSYAYGALAAAKFLVKQRPGLYTMADVLGL